MYSVSVNFFLYSVWFSIDTIDYYSAFIFYMCWMGLISGLKHVYAFLFPYTAEVTRNHKQPLTYFEKRFQSLTTVYKDTTTPTNIFSSKNNTKWLVYAWLCGPKFNHKTDMLSRIFEDNLSLTTWPTESRFFIRLYNLLKVFNRLNSGINFKQLDNLNNMNKPNNYFLESMDLNNYTSINLWYILNQKNSYFTVKSNNNKSLNMLNLQKTWNLSNFSTETENYSSILNSKTGLINLSDFTNNQLNNLIFNSPEANTITYSIRNHLDSIKWDRWLYKYSLLHRKSLKNTTKLTLAKKALHLNFFNSKLTDSNIWASESSKYFMSDNATMSSFFNLYYSNLYKNPTSFNSNIINSKLFISNNTSDNFNLQLLNDYEDGYFFFLKRFYIFNNLLNNNYMSSVSIKNNSTTKLEYFNEFKSLKLNKNFTLVSYLLNSSKVNLNSLSTKSYINDSTFNYNNAVNTNISNDFKLKDFYLILNTDNILSYDNLRLLNWLTTSSTNSSSNLNLFNYLTINVNYSYQSKFYRKNVTTNTTTRWLVNSLVDFDQLLLEDLSKLTLL